MSDFLTCVNTWIQAHQAIVATTGIPLLIALSSAIVAILTNRSIISSQEKDRDLQRRSIIFSRQMEKIEALRETVAELEPLYTYFWLSLESGLILKKSDHGNEELIHATLQKLLTLRTKILMLVPTHDPERSITLAAIDFTENAPLDIPDKPENVGMGKLVQVSERVIKRMQDAAERSFTP